MKAWQASAACSWDNGHTSFDDPVKGQKPPSVRDQPVFATATWQKRSLGDPCNCGYNPFVDQALPSPATLPRRRRRSNFLTTALYFRALCWEFRFSLLSILILLIAGALLYRIAPQESLDSARPDLLTALYASWMALLAQPVFEPPQPWFVELLQMLYPIAGFILVGEGVVRFALLMVSKRQGEKEWMRVMASTYRDHIIVCGLGHLGVRVMEELAARGLDVVVLEKDPDSRFISNARSLNVPVVIRNMKEDQALLDVGIERASSIIIATNDDMANIEVALDARRLNPKIRVIMRLFEQEIARKISGALTVDAAFSSSTLAAPIVTAMSLGTKVMSNVMIAGTPYAMAEVPVTPGSAVDGKRVDQIELGYTCRVLALLCPDGRKSCPPLPAESITGGQTLVVHVNAEQLAGISAAAS